MIGPRIPLGLSAVVVPAGGEATSEGLCVVDGFVSVRMVLSPGSAGLEVLRVDVDGALAEHCATGPAAAFGHDRPPVRSVLSCRLGQRVSVTFKNPSSEPVRASAVFIGNVFTATELEEWRRCKERVPA